MELQEDVAAKVEIIKKAIATEADLLPQGNLPNRSQEHFSIPWDPSYL
jgi:hypothetical protein